MNRALVIYGDRQLGGAIADGLTVRELEMVRAELRQIQARDGVRAYGDSVRWESVAGALAMKYSTRHHGRLYGAILGVWALLWMVVFEWARYLQAWNRGTL